MRRLSVFLFAAFVLANAGPVFAYSHTHCLGENVKWSSNSKTMRASTTSFPAGYWYNGLLAGINATNLNPSKFRYYLTTDSSVSKGNGQSEVWGENISPPAVAYTWRTCYWLFGDHVYLNELDIVFDYGSPWQWTANTTKSSLIRYGGTGRSMQGTAGHELGHGLKQNHVNTTYNIMGADFEHIHANGGTARAYFGEDAANGAVHLYGLRSGAWEDVGVVHWKYAGASGEYSDHTKTKVYNSAGGNLSTLTINGETGYRVNPGQVVRAEFTYENNGKTYQGDVDTRYYISTNDYISTWDTHIGSSTFTLGRNTVYTTTKTLTIPSNLNSGQNYWLGVVVDYNGQIGEAVEWNNATYLPIRVN